ncbi:tripartite tricarboxylate transporter substrate binding protein [Ramlibacter sp. H39-3-26]|uniref:Bug family tripartite tricarboxylate transporter substrate binding protein n=1 Tax=Curvibacter soli TaxID=3031331 RepID=UPI0023D9D7E8|nr:tripartite tricarboxylate transporter substrate binding protein [Ramlibacter sp. H39-3-26]MDF1486000.1 tripartite tricarboxylate transporter substrate binding protein [Ramlibacter sp. H39-3-26]
MFRRSFLSLASAPALAMAAGAAHAQATYPAKPIRLIVPFPPGGGTDILARLVGTRLTAANPSWTVVPDNRAGAGGTIGLAEAARAAPTGYEIVLGQRDNMVVAPWLYKNVGYDPTRDFAAIAGVAYTPIIIVTGANSRFKTLADVVKAAQAAPDAVTYGSPGNGTTIHLAGEIFKNAAGIKIRHVPYKGSNPAMMDVLAGNVDLMVSSVPSAMGQLKSGKLRALAVTSAARSTSLPDVPTVAESGYKDVDVSTWYALFAPAGTARDVVAALYREVSRALATPDMQSAIHQQGAEPQPMAPEQLAALVKADYEKWRVIVRDTGATIE